MFYNYLKILHILSAGILLTSVIYSCKQWFYGHVLERIQTQTWFVIIPFALFQLGTGFTMISLKHDVLTPVYIKGSVIAFVAAIISWMLFSYFVLTSQPRKFQKIFLLTCLISLLCMIFFMASRL